MNYKALKDAIKSSPFTQTALAEKCKISQSQFNRMVNGKRPMPTIIFKKICEELGEEPDLFLEIGKDFASVTHGDIDHNLREGGSMAKNIDADHQELVNLIGWQAIEISRLKEENAELKKSIAGSKNAEEDPADPKTSAR